MPEQVDPYREWLGVKVPDRPLNHYQLLRLDTFEDDVDKIRKHYRKLNTEVRKYAAGQYGELSQEVLNELAKAMLCLTDAKRKAEYDASLGRTDAKQIGRSLEEILLSRRLVTTEQLDKARKYASAVGVEVREALVQQKFLTQEQATQAYAESVGVAFISLSDVGVDEQMVPRVPALIARKNSCVPVMVDDGQLLMASPNLLHPEVEDDLRLRIDMPVRTVLCVAAEIHPVINQYFPREAAEAELAGRGAAGKPADKAAGGASAPESSKQPGGGKKQASREQQALIIPLIAAMVTAMPTLVVLNFLAPRGAEIKELGISAAVGAVTALVTFLFVKMRP